MFEDMDSGDEIVFTAPSPSTGTGAAPKSMSVALEHKPIEFLVSHEQEAVQEVPLSFIGTIAFYLDPDAKIFKIEVLNTLEGAAGAGREHKRRRY